MNIPIARQPRGIPAGGRFAGTGHPESEVRVGLPADGPQVTDTGFEGRQSGQPETAPGRFGGDDTDLAVDTVMYGPLSRGVCSAGRRAGLKSWHEWVQRRGLETGDPDYADFAAGLKTGTAALYEEHLGGDRISPAVLDLALQAAAKKRTTGQSREHWRRLLKHAPSESWHRGHLAAGIILSGADGYWGMRDNAERTVKGGQEWQPC